jgi:hypothetical protein
MDEARAARLGGVVGFLVGVAMTMMFMGVLKLAKDEREFDAIRAEPVLNLSLHGPKLATETQVWKCKEERRAKN